MSSRTLAALGLAAALVTGAAACAQEASAPPVGSNTTVALPTESTLVPPDGDLYTLAEGFEPGEPGEVIAVQPVTDHGLQATVLRVLHHSRSVSGEDIAVSGLVAVPPGPAPAGGRPVLSWAHGTTGIADECAPSKDPTSALAMAPAFLERGMVVAATDYEGLGTPGRHPYLVGESEGRGVLDVVRAARALGGEVGASDEVVVWGHSQGGHAALFANQIAPDYAPELRLAGTVAGAPAASFEAMFAAMVDTPFRFFLGMVTAGWAAAYPDADPADVLTDEAVAALDAVDAGCTLDLTGVWRDLDGDELVRADPRDVEPWRTLLVENEPGGAPGASPVLLLHGIDDQLVPAPTSERLLERICEHGQVVERLTYPADHVSVVGQAFDDMLAWIDARLAGEPAPSACPG